MLGVLSGSSCLEMSDSDKKFLKDFLGTLEGGWHLSSASELW